MKKEDLKLFINIPTLVTDRLLLRKISTIDIYDVFEYASDPEVSKYLMWHPHRTLAYTKDYLKYLGKMYRKSMFYDWGITYNGKMIGTVGFSSFDIKNNTGEIGYVLNRKFWGIGIATEAVKRVIDFGFNELSLDRIEAIFLPENFKSRGVLLKCGLQCEGISRSALVVKGERRDVETFSILKEDYVSNNQN